MSPRWGGWPRRIEGTGRLALAVEWLKIKNGSDDLLQWISNEPHSDLARGSGSPNNQTHPPTRAIETEAEPNMMFLCSVFQRNRGPEWMDRRGRLRHDTAFTASVLWYACWAFACFLPSSHPGHTSTWYGGRSLRPRVRKRTLYWTSGRLSESMDQVCVFCEMTKVQRRRGLRARELCCHCQRNEYVKVCHHHSGILQLLTMVAASQVSSVYIREK
jgi:hypothetical protein